MTTGFQVNQSMLYIDKDPEAVLTYTFDWSEWLESNDAINAVEYSLQVRANDPKPLVNEDDGFVDSKTYITLSGGQVERTYTVTAKVTTTNGLVDRRHFKVKVYNRSA